MTLSPLPNTWNLYNLKSSPYFQATLDGEHDESERPLRLFVGRHGELAKLNNDIVGSANGATRHAIAGAPGVGKTTLVQALKAHLRPGGYFSTVTHVSMLPDDTAGTLLGRIVASVYETILVNRPMTAGNPAMQAAQAMSRVTRSGSRGLNISAAGFGLGASSATSNSVPNDIMLDGPRVLKNLLAILDTADARGVILHLNNLENLSEVEATSSADVLRSLRDVVLQCDYLHTLVVGTTGAVDTAINRHEQIRTLFTVTVLPPLNEAEVHQLLLERYRFLRLDGSQGVRPPVTDETVAALYALFRGDLRGLLGALAEGVGAVLGLSPATVAPGKGKRGVVLAPLAFEDIRPTLQQTYLAQLQNLEERRKVEHLIKWGTNNPRATHTQRALRTLWGLGQSAVSITLDYLTRRGYVVALPKSGNVATEYALSGVSRLIFG
jgi:hypothetical protein